MRSPTWIRTVVALLAMAGSLSRGDLAARAESPEKQLKPDTEKVSPKTPLRVHPAGAKSDAEESESETPDSGSAAPMPARVRVSSLRPPMLAEARHEWADRLKRIYSQPTELWPRPLVDKSVVWKELGSMPKVEHPADNPFSVEKARLGLLLFFDPRLSGSGQMACASCHDPEHGWTDGRSTAIGNKRKALKRNTPSLLNVAYEHQLFWDGRAGSLEQQARAVLLNPDEMNSSEKLVLQRLGEAKGYAEHFRASFGDESISFLRVTQAVSCFERTLVSGRSRFDAFLQGKQDALEDEAVIGLHLFRTEARCMNCHHSPSFSDGGFHDLGLSYYGHTLEDLGRYQITKQNEDSGRFKTPSLRNVGRTGPYMHNGLFPLDGVMNLYNVGMPTLRRNATQRDDARFPTKSPLLQPLLMNRQDLDAVKAFLESLDEPPLRMRLPQLP